MPPDTLYADDLVLWTAREADALRQAARAGSNLPLDWDNLAEEIESVGRSERSAVRSLERAEIALTAAAVEDEDVFLPGTPLGPDAGRSFG